MKKTILVLLGLILSTTTFAQCQGLDEATLLRNKIREIKKNIQNPKDLFNELKKIYQSSAFNLVRYNDVKETIWTGVCEVNGRYNYTGLYIFGNKTWKAGPIDPNWSLLEIASQLSVYGVRSRIWDIDGVITHGLYYEDDAPYYKVSQSLTISNQVMDLDIRKFDEKNTPVGYRQSCFLTKEECPKN
jgi:hypothetical protein